MYFTPYSVMNCCKRNIIFTWELTSSLHGRPSRYDFRWAPAIQESFHPYNERISDRALNPTACRGEMSDNGLEETGYMSRRAFDEACQAVTRCLGSRSIGLSVEIRRGVRLHCWILLSGSFFQGTLYKGIFCSYAHLHLGTPRLPDSSTSSKHQPWSTYTIRLCEALPHYAGF